MTSTAFVTGATGQIGSIACKELIKKGYKVYGMKRCSSSINTERLNDIYVDPHIDNSKFELVYGDLTDPNCLNSLIADIKPDLLFNYGSQAHVKISFNLPAYTALATGNSVLNCLEAIRQYSPKTRFITSSSSEQFGSSPPPQILGKTPFAPRSVYATAKLFGYFTTIHYRERGLFACNSLNFNSESKYRSELYVTRKITRAATRIKLGLQDKLYLGNIDAARDWQHSEDAFSAAYSIITASEPKDYAVCSGVMRTVREFLQIVFDKLELDWQDYVIIDKKYFRPTEVDALCGDPTPLIRDFNFQPKYTFEMLVNEMVEHDMMLAKQELLIKNGQK